MANITHIYGIIKIFRIIKIPSRSEICQLQGNSIQKDMSTNIHLIVKSIVCGFVAQC